MTDRSARPGWGLTLIGLAVALAAIAVSIGLFGTGEAGLRAAVRATARWSAIVFVITFASSSLHALLRRDWTRWLLARRRRLGLGFAAAHFVHLGVVIALAELHSASFWAHVSTTTVIGGSVGYVWIAAMAATSFDGAQRRMGRAWRALHTSGMYVLWLIFVFSYSGRAASSPIYATLTVALLVAVLLRCAARIARWKRLDRSGAAVHTSGP